MLAAHLFRYVSYLVAGAVTHPTRRLTAEWWDEHYSLGGLSRTEGSAELPRYLMVAGLVAHHAPATPVLDVGCGAGRLLETLRAHGASGPSRYVGVDLSRRALDAAEERWVGAEHVMFIEADADLFPLDEKFGAIVFSESLYYSTDPCRTVRRYVDALLPGGVVVVSMWRRPSRWRVWRALAVELEEVSRVRVAVPWRPSWDIAVCKAHQQSASTQLSGSRGRRTAHEL